MYNQDSRVGRDRIARLVEQAQLIRRDPPDTARKIVGSVFNGGAMPTTVPAWFFAHPADFGCTEAEGGPCAPDIDTTSTVPILVLGPKVPGVGDLLPARMIGGKWVTGGGGKPKGVFPVKVTTDWCPNCVTPGTITVTVRANNSTGTVVCSGTADAQGNFVCDIPSFGTYWFGASTTASGFLNFPQTVAITTSGPSTVFSQLAPTQLRATSPFGTVTLLPSGPAGLCGAVGGADSYIGTITFNAPANCNCGVASGLQVDYFFQPCNTTGSPFLKVCFQCAEDPLTFDECPGTAAGKTTVVATWQSGAMTGVGPQQAVCYPVNLSNSIGVPQAPVGNNPNNCVSIIMGICTLPSTATFPFTVTQ